MQSNKIKTNLTQTQIANRKILIIFIISLLVHLLSLITFFDVQTTGRIRKQEPTLIFFDQNQSMQPLPQPAATALPEPIAQQSTPLVPEKPVPIKQEEKMPATLKAGKFMPRTAENKTDDKINSDAALENKIEEQKIVPKSKQLAKVIKKAPAQLKQKNKAVEQALIRSNQFINEAQQLIAQEESKEIVEQDEPEARQQPEESIFKTKKRSEEKAKKTLLSMTSKFVDQLKGKQNKSLIDKGVMNFVINEKGYGFERKGDDNREPTEEELLVIHYDEDVCRRWQSSLMLNFAYLISKRGQTTLRFTINKKGTLIETEVLNSSGDKRFDQMIVHSLKFAAPFEAFPHGMNNNLHSQTVTFHIN